MMKTKIAIFFYIFIESFSFGMINDSKCQTLAIILLNSTQEHSYNETSAYLTGLDLKNFLSNPNRKIFYPAFQSHPIFFARIEKFKNHSGFRNALGSSFYRQFFGTINTIQSKEKIGFIVGQDLRIFLETQEMNRERLPTLLTNSILANRVEKYKHTKSFRASLSDKYFFKFFGERPLVVSRTSLKDYLEEFYRRFNDIPLPSAQKDPENERKAYRLLTLYLADPDFHKEFSENSEDFYFYLTLKMHKHLNQN